MLDAIYDNRQIPVPTNERKIKTNPLNDDNFNKKEFQQLWTSINKQATYHVNFDSAELRVRRLQYIVRSGIQTDPTGFALKHHQSNILNNYTPSSVKYDLLGIISKNTQLTRLTIAQILSNIEKSVFEQFKQNPEEFITQATRLINEQKATVLIKELTYELTTQSYDTRLFTSSQASQDFNKAIGKMRKHIYDYVIADSQTERDFARQLDSAAEVAVYAKLPRSFLIPTPIGDYSPDWAIAFTQSNVKHIYFVAETKGSMSSMELRDTEKLKIKCAEKFFAKINSSIQQNKVKYSVINNYDALRELIIGR